MLWSGSVVVGSMAGGVSSMVTHFCLQAVWTGFDAETFPVADRRWGGSAWGQRSPSVEKIPRQLLPKFRNRGRPESPIPHEQS